MVLMQLKHCLSNMRTANLSMLSQLVNAEPGAVRAMLEFWIGKGCVRKCQPAANCATLCNKCNPLLTEVYEWVG